MGPGQDNIRHWPSNLPPPQPNDNHEGRPENAGVKHISPTPIALDAGSLQILKDILETLKGSTIAQEVAKDPRSRLWAIYRREAKEYDESFLERYKDDMDIVLIFAGLFSAVSTTFITSIQSNLDQDPTAITNTLLMQIVHANNASAFAGQNLELPPWNGPGPMMIWTQSLIFASLAASLLAALGAVLGKQWLANYRQPISGTSEERGLSRQRKLDALNNWHFQAMLEVLPILLQASLLLFGTALSAYVWAQQATVGAIVIGATVFGVLFYASITIASLVSIDCPFQTPLTSMVRLIQPPLTQWSLQFRMRIAAVCVHHYEHIQLRFPAFNPILCSTTATKFPLVVRRVMSIPIFFVLVSYIFVKEFTKNRIAAIKKSMKQIVRHSTRSISPNTNDPEIQPTPISVEPVTLDLSLPSRPLHEHEAPAVRWLLETSTDQDVLLIAAQLVPDIEWPDEVDVSEAYAQLKNAFIGCFESAPGNPLNLVLTAFGEKRAYFFGKALLHLSCTRQHFANAENENHDHHQLVQYFNCLGSNEDVNSSCLPAMANGLVYSSTFATYMGVYSISPFDRRWLLHLFPYLLAYLGVPSVGNLVITEITKWLDSPSPSRKILADCFLSVAITMGMPIVRNDWVKMDKSSAAEKLLKLLLQQLASVDDITANHSVRSVQGAWAEALLQPLADFLDRGEIFPDFGKCEPKECACDIVSWIAGIAKSYVFKATQAVEPSQQAQAWKHARIALRLGAVLSAMPPNNHRKHDRWNPTYRGHPYPFIVDNAVPEWVVKFLDHHYDIQTDVAIADMLYMLSQSRDFEQWANSAWFIQVLVRAVHHDKIRVRDSALQVIFTMRHALWPSLASSVHWQNLLPSLYTAVPAKPPAVNPSSQSSNDFVLNTDRNFCFLRILYTVTLHHGDIWVTDLFQTKVSEQFRNLAECSRWCSSTPIPIYVIAILEILVDRDTKCNFRNSLDQNLVCTILSNVWLIVGGLIVDNQVRSAKIGKYSLRVNSEILDEVLPHLIAFTIRCQKSYRTAMAQFKYLPDPKLILEYLQHNRPESPAIALLHEMISNITPHSE